MKKKTHDENDSYIILLLRGHKKIEVHAITTLKRELLVVLGI